MKEQYVGDINDYRKYALLRCLQAGSGLPVGVCWMLTPSDGRSDGNKTGYLNQPDNERHDPDLFALLRAVAADPNRRRLINIEGSGILPGATFHHGIVPDHLAARVAWFGQALSGFADRELIFFDPDNGLDVKSKRKGSLSSSKYLYRDELAATYAAGHSVLVYQHFPREERQAFVNGMVAGIRSFAWHAEVWEFRTAHVAFLLLIRPEHHDRLHAAARSVSRFEPSFLSASLHAPL